MKVIDFAGSDVQLEAFSHRGCNVRVFLVGDTAKFDVSGEYGAVGLVSLSNNEASMLSLLLRPFFKEGERGKTFHSDTPLQSNIRLPGVKLSSTNWGEPFSEGVEFVFSMGPSHDCPEVTFALEESAARVLLEMLENKKPEVTAEWALESAVEGL